MCNKLNMIIVIPMSTNCAPLLADLHTGLWQVRSGCLFFGGTRSYLNFFYFLDVRVCSVPLLYFYFGLLMLTTVVITTDNYSNKSKWKFKFRHDFGCFRNQYVCSKVTHKKVSITLNKNKHPDALVSNNTSGN